jgi:hypothetical protein
MHANQIDRRKALTVVAAAPAAVALADSALADTDEDAQLVNLWEQWKAQLGRCRVANDACDEASAAVNKEVGPYWDLVAVKGEPWRAIFISSWHDDTTQRVSL